MPAELLSPELVALRELVREFGVKEIRPRVRELEEAGEFPRELYREMGELGFFGACFSEGLGVERDPALALRWLSLAADGGDPVGQRNLATAYFKGLGVPSDGARAAR